MLLSWLLEPPGSPEFWTRSSRWATDQYSPSTNQWNIRDLSHDQSHDWLTLDLFFKCTIFCLVCDNILNKICICQIVFDCTRQKVIVFYVKFNNLTVFLFTHDQYILTVLYFGHILRFLSEIHRYLPNKFN